MGPTDKFIFVIEDSTDMRYLIEELLQREGYRVESAVNGLDGINKLKTMTQKPDLILLDLMMPIMDGFGFREKQAEDKSIANIPVIIMTADANIETKTAKASAATGLRKPIEIDDLLSAIENIVS